MGRLNSINKQAQIWGLDVAAASLVFLIAISFFYIYTINYRGSSKEKIEEMSYEGRVLSDAVLGPGYPRNWNSENVEEIGVVDLGHVNETKLWMFYNLTLSDYGRTKNLFNIHYDYYFFFDDPIDFGTAQIDGIGMPGANRSNINPVNLVKIERVVNYKNKPKKVTFYIFER